MITEAQIQARQALIDSMAAVSIVSPEQMADMVLTELEDRGYTIQRKAAAAFRNPQVQEPLRSIVNSFSPGVPPLQIHQNWRSCRCADCEAFRINS